MNGQFLPRKSFVESMQNSMNLTKYTCQSRRTPPPSLSHQPIPRILPNPLPPVKFRGGGASRNHAFPYTGVYGYQRRLLAAAGSLRHQLSKRPAGGFFTCRPPAATSRTPENTSSGENFFGGRSKYIFYFIRATEGMYVLICVSVYGNGAGRVKRMGRRFA